MFFIPEVQFYSWIRWFPVQNLSMSPDCHAKFINDCEMGLESMFEVLDRFWAVFDWSSDFVCIKSVSHSRSKEGVCEIILYCTMLELLCAWAFLAIFSSSDSWIIPLHSWKIVPTVASFSLSILDCSQNAFLRVRMCRLDPCNFWKTISHFVLKH